MSKPLTIEELKALQVGDWVWVINLCKNRGTYRRITAFPSARGLYFDKIFDYEDYGRLWLAYKNKEQAEAEEYKIECDEQGGWFGYQYIPAYYQPLCTADTKEAVEALIKTLRGEK